MNAVTGDIGTLQPLGKLVGKESVTQLTVAVGVEELPAVATSAQVLLGLKGVEVNLAPAVGHGGQGDHAT